MDNVVNENVGELPTSVESTPTQQAPEYTEDTSASQSREDSNTQADRNEPERNVDSQAQGQQPYEPAWKQDEYRYNALEQQFLQQRQATLNQNYYPGQAAQTPYDQFATSELETKLAKLEHTLLWKEAMAEVPELASDRKLDDMVYSQYTAYKAAGRNVTPAQVAKEMKSYIDSLTKKTEKEVYSRAEQDIAEKSAVSRSEARRSPTKDSIDKTQAALENYRATGNDDVLLDIFKY